MDRTFFFVFFEKHDSISCYKSINPISMMYKYACI